MKHPLPLLIVLLALVLGMGSAAAIGAGRGAPGRVYTVAAVRAGLEQHPDAWLGRMVRVRGMVQPSGCIAWDAGGSIACRDRSAYLLDRAGASVLQVAGWGPDPLLARLRLLPLVGQLAPGPQVVRWGALATYRARLLAAPAALCDATPCYAALLLDAAPAGTGEG